MEVGEYRDGYVLLPNGKLHRCYGVITNSSALKKAKYEIFDHKSENEIAMLLTIKPGQVIGPSFGWGGAMTKDFLESLKHPIIPTADDTPENAELKRAVNQAKIELKAAYDRGEDIEKIFLDERAHFQKLMQFKDELVGETSRYRLEHPEATPQDMEDYCNAANKLLESKGIAPTMLMVVRFANTGAASSNGRRRSSATTTARRRSSTARLPKSALRTKSTNLSKSTTRRFGKSASGCSFCRNDRPTPVAP